MSRESLASLRKDTGTFLTLDTIFFPFLFHHSAHTFIVNCLVIIAWYYCQCPLYKPLFPHPIFSCATYLLLYIIDSLSLHLTHSFRFIAILSSRGLFLHYPKIPPVIRLVFFFHQQSCSQTRLVCPENHNLGNPGYTPAKLLAGLFLLSGDAEQRRKS